MPEKVCSVSECSQFSRRVDDVTLSPFSSPRDDDSLRLWLQRPHVARWWGDPQQQLEDCLSRPADGGHALILAGGTPVGYLRWQRPSRKELDAAGLSEIPRDAVDIDIMIGEQQYIGHGIGPRALTLLVEQLSQSGGFSLAVLATSVKNRAAIRAYQKAGFRRLREFDDPGYGRCCLLGIDLSTP